jgi:hypothetical protein
MMEIGVDDARDQLLAVGCRHQAPPSTAVASSLNIQPGFQCMEWCNHLVVAPSACQFKVLRILVHFAPGCESTKADMTHGCSCQMQRMCSFGCFCYMSPVHHLCAAI